MSFRKIFRSDSEGKFIRNPMSPVGEHGIPDQIFFFHFYANIDKTSRKFVRNDKSLA